MNNRSYHVTIWNEDIERGYTIIASSSIEAKQRAINAELERGVPFYRIHVESVELW